MPKKNIWETAQEILHRFPQGASLEEILVGMGPSTSRRTLQRHLSSFIKEGKIVVEGNARARRYKLSPLSPTKFSFFSQDGEWIYAKVSQPIQARIPVGYHREFLDNYHPNKSYYLPETLRQKLFTLGQCDGIYPAGTFARQIFNRLLIDLTWNSSRLEGNTYSLLETERLLELGKVAEGKDLKETQMILNHKAAIEFLINSAEEIAITRYTILNIHTLLSDNLMADSAACGRLRKIAVGISKSVYLPIAVPQVIEECFTLLIDKAQKIKDPFEQAFFLMIQLPYLQPFEDVNKRTSRLAANIPLIKNNLCPLSFIDVPEEWYISALLGVYELNRYELMRDLFVWAYERSCALYSTTQKSLGEPDPFRMRYRTAIYETIKEIILHKMNKTKAIHFLRNYASRHITALDQDRFIEFVERELRSLHEGNIARFHVRPHEYEAWKNTWS